ncbi:ATPase domain protein, prokaryote domain protein [Candidatus Magnetomoraceae bacterium gMMP-15]
MRIYLKEKIGNPELFTGRKKELASFLEWVEKIKPELAQSTAMLSRRKTGKTALLQRLYNIIFDKNETVIPFYYEIKETKKWVLDFSRDFFLEFIYQYIAFKTRKKEYIEPIDGKSIENAIKISQKEKLTYLINLIKRVNVLIKEEDTDILWDTVRDTPKRLSQSRDESIVQLIDEFQFLNRYIYWDKHKERRADDFVGSYFHTVEYKTAPLLVSGSWVGWLMDDIIRLLPGRFFMEELENMPEDECIEMIFKYSSLDNVPVTEKTAYVMAQLTEGNPFYISSMFRSKFPEKNFTNEENLRKTLEFEILNKRGIIRNTWLEYINSAFPRINDIYAKNMVLYLSKHRNRKVSRSELKDSLGLKMTDLELEKKLEALCKNDIIDEENSRYMGIQDNIFDKIFRSKYEDDIDKFISEELTNEYKVLFEEIQKKYKKLSGEHNRYKGAFAEFMIINNLKNKSSKNNELFKSMIENLPDDFEFTRYENVWSYTSPPLYELDFQIDIFAKAMHKNYSLIGEVKNRKTTKFSLNEALDFTQKVEKLKYLENIEKAVLFVFSSCGFTKDALLYFKKNNMAWTKNNKWIKI